MRQGGYLGTMMIPLVSSLTVLAGNLVTTMILMMKVTMCFQEARCSRQRTWAFCGRFLSMPWLASAKFSPVLQVAYLHIRILITHQDWEQVIKIYLAECHSTCASFPRCLFVSSWLFCHVDIDVCIYSTCAFLIVKWTLMLIAYSATSS